MVKNEYAGYDTSSRMRSDTIQSRMRGWVVPKVLFTNLFQEVEGSLKRRVDAAVKRETIYIAVWTAVLSALMEAVFLILGRWDVTVLLGNLLGGLAAVLNFFLMGLTVQSAVDKPQDEARTAMKASQALRSVMLLVVLVTGAAAPCFHLIAAILPLFFPRIAIALRPLWDKAGRREEKTDEK